MKTFRDVTVVDAPPEDVFEFFRSMDEDRYLAWHPEHEAFEFVEGDRVEEGSLATFEERIGEEHLRSTVRYTRVQPPRYVEFRARNPIVRLFNPKNAFAFEAVDGGTRFGATVDLRIGPIGWFSSVRRDLDELRRHMREEGEDLKRLVEGGRFGGGGRG